MTRPDSFPEFIIEARKIYGPRFKPLAYLNQQDGMPFVIAAQWLYVPDFVEYRGGVFRTQLPDGLDDESRTTLDDWHTHHNGNVSKVEAIGNLLTFWDLFVGNNTEPYEDDLAQLARTVARSWNALLRTEFPDRHFRVEIYDGESSYGAQVTFFSVPTAAEAGLAVYE